jgi:hypothetical protein
MRKRDTANDGLLSVLRRSQTYAAVNNGNNGDG